MLAVLLAASAAFAAPGLKPGAVNEFSVELPMELRKLAGRGQVSPVTHALVAIAVPANIDMAHEWPVLVVSATSDPQFHSSRKLMSAYAETALAAGWIVVAADPAEEVAAEQDDVPLRLALVKAALAALALQWPGSDKAPLAFGGFSGGAKYSGWLAAAFASEGRNVIGIYLAGINQDTLVAAAEQFHVLDAKFKNVPVFLQSGRNGRDRHAGGSSGRLRRTETAQGSGVSASSLFQGRTKSTPDRCAQHSTGSGRRRRRIRPRHIGCAGALPDIAAP